MVEKINIKAAKNTTPKILIKTRTLKLNYNPKTITMAGTYTPIYYIMREYTTVFALCSTMVYILFFLFPINAIGADPQAPKDLKSWIIRSFDSLDDIRFKFSHVDNAGNISSGEIFLKNKHIRCEYEEPNSLVLVANRWRIMVYDHELDDVYYVPTSDIPIVNLLTNPQSLEQYDLTYTSMQDIRILLPNGLHFVITDPIF